MPFEQLQKFQATEEETGSTEETKLALLADQIGVDLKKSTDDEKRSLLNMFSRSKFTRFFIKKEIAAGHKWVICFPLESI